MYHDPVCVKCKCNLKPEANGVEVIDFAGRETPRPYKIWSADKWKCPKCGIEIVVDFAPECTGEWEGGFFKRRLDHAYLKELAIESYER